MVVQAGPSPAGYPGPSPGGYYWGYLIRSDKSATPLFEQLCLGIAKLIVNNVPPSLYGSYLTHIVSQSKITPSSTDDLTPPKLAAFYRAVGGDYDPLFLYT